MHRFIHASRAGLIAAALMLAGCSGSAGSPASGSAGSAASSIAPSSAAAPSGAAPGDSTAPGGSAAPGDSTAGQGGTAATCKQLTFDEVQPLLTDPITKVEVAAFGLSGTGQECRFEAADASENVDVTVVGGSDGAAEYNSDVADFPSPAPLPGVGDQAMWDKSDESPSFAALKGGVYCTVNASDEDIPGVGALMDAANNTLRIGDANWVIISTALATLCNRIYGSGDTTIDLSHLAPGPAVSPDLP